MIGHSEFNARRPSEYGESVEFSNATVDSIFNRKKGETSLRFPAIPARETTGREARDFSQYRQLVAEGPPTDEALFELAIGRPRQT